MCLFLNGNASLAGDPINKVGCRSEAHWVSLEAATFWAKADDAKIDETGSIRDGQRAATVTLEITGSRSVPFDQNVGRDLVAEAEKLTLHVLSLLGPTQQ